MGGGVWWGCVGRRDQKYPTLAGAVPPKKPAQAFTANAAFLNGKHMGVGGGHVELCVCVCMLNNNENPPVSYALKRDLCLSALRAVKEEETEGACKDKRSTKSHLLRLDFRRHWLTPLQRGTCINMVTFTQEITDPFCFYQFSPLSAISWPRWAG